MNTIFVEHKVDLFMTPPVEVTFDLKKTFSVC